MLRLFILFILIFSHLINHGQVINPTLSEDSTFMESEIDGTLFEEVSDLDPQRAALLSAVFPGLGQIYNKQYWKLPLVFSGFFVFGHFISYNNKIYHSLRNTILIVNAGGESPFPNITTVNTLVRNRDAFRRSRDFLIILGVGFYLLQVVDANIAAHLEEFILNKDLAINIKPSIQSSSVFSQIPGLSLTINF